MFDHGATILLCYFTEMQNNCEILHASGVRECLPNRIAARLFDMRG